jgi:hypothetical protein
LLKENAEIMRQRIEYAESPDITQFNVAMVHKPRLPVFQSITAKKPKVAEKNESKPATLNYRASNQQKMRDDFM